MLTKSQIVNVVLGAILVNEMRVGRINRTRFRKNYALGLELQAELATERMRSDYLSDVLDKHEIPVDDFDIIVLHNLL